MVLGELDNWIRTSIARLCEADIPSGWLALTGAPLVSQLAADLGVGPVRLIEGNLHLGHDVETADVIVSAHLDEAAFSLTALGDTEVCIRPTHGLAEGGPLEDLAVRFVGVREGRPWRLEPACVPTGRGPAGTLNVRVPAHHGLRPGDRAVYATPVEASGAGVTGKALDDRVGAVITLAVLSQVSATSPRVAVVLSDGEQAEPDGAFSRTFVRSLRQARPGALVAFVDGIFHEREASWLPVKGAASLVPHSGDGRGYIVPPRLYAWLRDQVVPGLQDRGIEAGASLDYRSRGDDWGLVCNPAAHHDIDSCFVSFNGLRLAQARKHVQVESARNVAATVIELAHTMKEWSNEGR